jgi:hypothetical protein
MKFLFKQDEDQKETMRNRGTEIKEVPWFTIVSYAIHYNNIYHCPHKSVAQEMFQDKVSHVGPKKDEATVNMVLAFETRN